MAFVAVCSEGDLAPGRMARFDVAGLPVAVYNVDGTIWATAAICTHEHAVLTEGELVGKAVRCPLHGARFDVTTGRVLSPPAFKKLRCYPARIADGHIEVDIS